MTSEHSRIFFDILPLHFRRCTPCQWLYDKAPPERGGVLAVCEKAAIFEI